jgi:hypothetical protein
MTNYTLEVCKIDRRTSDGERLVHTMDFSIEPELLANIKNYISEEVFPASKGFRVEVIETLLTKRNYMTGETFQERYDTPYFCSPSSETFWSN